jgi:hypothetical protein
MLLTSLSFNDYNGKKINRVNIAIVSIWDLNICHRFKAGGNFVEETLKAMLNFEIGFNETSLIMMTSIKP